MKTMHLNKTAVNQYVKIYDAKTKWLVGKPWRGWVASQEAPDWHDLSNDARAKLVKEGDRRQMWRVTADNEAVYAKIFHNPSLFNRIVGLMGCSKAAREWNVLTQASIHHLPVPEPIALGAGRSNTHTRVLLTRAIHGAEPLTQVWHNAHCGEQNASNRSRHRAIIRATAALFADAHNGGFIHRDAHPGNIVVVASAQAADAYQAWFVDVHGSTMQAGKLAIAQVVQSLAQIDQHFHRTASRTNRLRFLISYLKKRGVRARGDDSKGLLRDYVGAVLSARLAHAQRLAKQRNRRLRRDGKYFGVVRCAGGWRGRVVKQLSRRHVFPEQDIPDRCTRQWREFLEKLMNRVKAVDSQNATFELDGLIVEWRHPVGYIGRWRWTLFGSPWRNAFFNSHHKRHRDIECPLILGYLEHRSAGLIDTAAIIRPLPIKTKSAFV